MLNINFFPTISTLVFFHFNQLDSLSVLIVITLNFDVDLGWESFTVLDVVFI